MDGEIRPDEVAELVDAGSVCVVDIRNELSYDRGHIPGSTNLPFHRLTQEVDRFDDCDRVVTVCPHGKASVQAANLIASYEGFHGTVESMAGGLEAWDGELTQTERDNGDEDEGPAPF
ncbi:rhodanese-like domain-containing protein [Haloarchaeobius sp. TZWWS8]|uniref:rhodanese-like domain-containing protein n=1 Tax=Haloarchaeobius sp. TZWWS8 TaxID=3446121 RepID=UPI003EB8F73D